MSHKALDKEVQRIQFAYEDLMKYEPEGLYSSLGKMTNSKLKSKPTFKFGTSTRKQTEKLFQNKELSKTALVGKNSKGPIYKVRHTDKFTYHKGQEYKFGTNERNTLDTRAKYDYYHRHDQDFYPHESNLKRRRRPQSAKIGLETRFRAGHRDCHNTPGPIYNAPHKSTKHKYSKYTFGYRRNTKGYSPLEQTSCTPARVGPGLYKEPEYMAKKRPISSMQRKYPIYSIPKYERFKSKRKDRERETYDTQSAFRFQPNSCKKTRPVINFGKQQRFNNKKGHFKDLMSQNAPSVRIQLPKSMKS